MQKFFALALGLSSLSLAACSSSSANHETAADAGGSSETSTTDGAASDAPAGDATPAPIMINAPNDTWTWVDIPGAVCGNGSPTGIGINPHAGAKHLLFYLEAGGACFDGDMCWGAMPAASNMTGYDATNFASESTKNLVIFDRTNTGNPWNDATLVFVPYCTGDLHIGGTEQVANWPMPTYFHGGINVKADLASLALTYTGLSHVWIAGSSAGGFGSFLNQYSAAQAFPGLPVDVLDDSGPAVSFALTVSDLPWGVLLPEGCSGCESLPALYAFDRKTYPNSKFGFMTYQTDSVLPDYFVTTEPAFAAQIQTFIGSMANDPNAKSFVALSTGHVVLFEQDTTANPFILPWLTQMVNDDPAWANVQH
jgi:hypothetical protein